MNSASIVDIDDTGDTLVTFYSKENMDIGNLRVSAKALSLASPVIKAMLDPAKGFSEAHSTEDGLKKIRLAADDLDLVLAVMNIVHHRNSNVPKEVGIEFLYELASFCDCYQFQEAVGPRVHHWALCMCVSKKDLPLYCTRWIWISKVFRMDKLFKECAQTAAFHMRLTEPTSFAVGQETFHPAMSDFVQTILWKEREKLVDKFIGAYETKVRMFQESLSQNKTSCSLGVETSRECDIAQLGSLFSLKLLIGYPEHYLDDLSLVEISDIYKNIVGLGQWIKFRQLGVSGNQRSHSECNVLDGFKRVAEEVEGIDISLG